jgi:two-component system nitrate/nitrite response regulator NarL
VDSYRLLLIDDHPMLRKGVRQLIDLEDDLEVVAEASSGEEGIAIAKEVAPDLILLDLGMKGMDGMECLPRLKNDDSINAKVVIYTVSNEGNDIASALKHGADGYLLKDMDADSFVQKVREACQGKTVVSESLVGALAENLREHKSVEGEDRYNTLTRRERSIMKMIAEGLTNKMIAKRLDIAETTVKVHVKNLLKKMGMRSRVEAAVWVVNNSG